MRLLCALIFNFLFYLVFVFYMIGILPLMVFQRRIPTRAMIASSKSLVLLQNLFGIKIVVRGKENIPQGGCLVAAKHQSMWETIMLPLHFSDPAFVYKRELERIPLFGLYMRKFDMIPIDRSKGVSALRTMLKYAAEKIRQGRQVIIFPEGTRRPLGAAADYKTGIALLYEAVNAPVVPVALNSGAYWSNYFWRGTPGTIVIDILPPIMPSLDKEEFLQVLQTRIETAMKEILS